MKYNYDGIDYKIEIVDDGTLDTVLRVESIHEVRFDSEYARTETGGIVEQAITDAIEDYLEAKQSYRRNKS